MISSVATPPSHPAQQLAATVGDHARDKEAISEAASGSCCASIARGLGRIAKGLGSTFFYTLAMFAGTDVWMAIYNLYPQIEEASFAAYLGHAAAMGITSNVAVFGFVLMALYADGENLTYGLIDYLVRYGLLDSLYQPLAAVIRALSVCDFNGAEYEFKKYPDDVDNVYVKSRGIIPSSIVTFGVIYGVIDVGVQELLALCRKKLNPEFSPQPMTLCERLRKQVLEVSCPYIAFDLLQFLLNRIYGYYDWQDLTDYFVYSAGTSAVYGLTTAIQACLSKDEEQASAEETLDAPLLIAVGEPDQSSVSTVMSDAEHAEARKKFQVAVESNYALSRSQLSASAVEEPDEPSQSYSWCCWFRRRKPTSVVVSQPNANDSSYVPPPLKTMANASGR